MSPNYIVRPFSIRLRRSWRRGPVARLRIFALTVLLAFLPFWAVTSNSVFQDWMANRAMAATESRTPVVAKEDVYKYREPENYIPEIPGIVGMGEQFVEENFSAPDLQREEGGITVWQYREGECVVDFYMQGRDKKVVYYEVRYSRQASMSEAVSREYHDPESRRQCIESVRNRG